MYIFLSSCGALGAVAHDHDPPPAVPHLRHQHPHLRLQRILRPGAGTEAETGAPGHPRSHGLREH